jgi:hypothetical protein
MLVACAKPWAGFFWEEGTRLSSHTNVLKRTKSRINSWLQLLVAQQFPEYFALFHDSPFNCANYRSGCAIPIGAKIRFIRESLTITCCLSEQGEEMAVQNNQEDTLNITVEFT